MIDLREATRQRLQELGWSQSELARRANLRRATINKLVSSSGLVRLDTLQSAVDAMGGIDGVGWGQPNVSGVAKRHVAATHF